MGTFKFLKILPVLCISLAMSTYTPCDSQVVHQDITQNLTQKELNYNDDEIIILDSAKTLFTSDSFPRLECPLDDLIYPDHHEIKRQKLENLKARIMKDSQVIWLRDNAPLVRLNGHPVIKQFDNDSNAIIFFRPGPTDEGLYTCIVNYTAIPMKKRKLFRLKKGASFRLDVIDLSRNIPDIAPVIDHPPTNSFVYRGSNTTFTCRTIATFLTSLRLWFKSGPPTNATRINKFLDLYNITKQTKHEASLVPYIIQGHTEDELDINNITDTDQGYYGCMVINQHGMDIRLAELTVLETPIASQSHVTKLIGNIGTYPSTEATSQKSFIIPTIILSVLGCIMISIFLKSIKKLYLNHHKKDQKTLLPQTQPTTTFNGNFNQPTGHLLGQAINIRDHSISISSDEASSYGQSHGDSYLHTSHTTATTVPLYDHPPTLHGSCVINPLYGFLRPDSFMNGWAFPRRNLERLDKIGEGQFGEVWRFIAHQKDGTEKLVAVKQLKNRVGLGDRERFELLAEIEIMKSINDHPNVIKLLHYCADDYQPILLIMEYAEHGKLQTYLRNCRSPLSSAQTKSSNQDLPISSKELIKFTYHIAKGMEYVSSKGIIHRDLASRNILVSKDMVCKVADFGFARRVSNECAYERTTANPVPVKWMAPEALVQNTFTAKSDVFSLGIVMWEIVTLGATPYENLTSAEVFTRVTSGQRLERPAHCKDEFFTIMERCWRQNPTERPTFNEVADDLEALLVSETNYIELDRYPEHAYYNITSVAEKEVVIGNSAQQEEINVMSKPSKLLTFV